MSPDPQTHTLPEPGAEALAHSERLSAAIRAEIAASPGASIAFSRFMELALYAPGLGYYSAGASKFGAEGDFVTAPELGAVFATCVADAVAPVLRELAAASAPETGDALESVVLESVFLELGGGTGAFAEVALQRLDELDALPARYAILEPSAQLRQRQRERLQQRLSPELFDRVQWLDGPMPHDWNGVLFANEVLDALPTPRFAIEHGEVCEEHVVVDGEGPSTSSFDGLGTTLRTGPSTSAAPTLRTGFARVLRPADAFLGGAVRNLERRLERPLEEGYRSELLPQLPYWIQAVSGGLKRGAMLFVDYGYPRGEYYQPGRRDGTLRAFYRHRIHHDPLLVPGLQDLTASVDFTALAEAGVAAGFEFAGYCSQASFLLGNGLAGVLAGIEGSDDVAERQRRGNEVKRLTLPGEMGERFQVMGFERDVDFGAAFDVGDLSHRL